MKTILILFILSTSIVTYAQQDIISTTFWNNYAHINPAMSALEYKKHGSFMYRNDKVSINNYKSILANYNFRLAEKHGLGINFDFNKGPVINLSQLNLNYNYQLDLFQKGKLNIGVGLGVTGIKIQDENFTFIDVDDSTINLAQKTSFFNPNLGLSYTSGNFMIGVGSINLLEGEFASRTEEEIAYSPSRQFYFNGHYKILLGKKKNVEMRPQFILRTDLEFSSLDLNALVTYKKKYWAGFTYRKSNAYAFMLGWDLKEKLRVGYSFDLVQSKLTASTQKAHEISLGLFLK